MQRFVGFSLVVGGIKSGKWLSINRVGFGIFDGRVEVLLSLQYFSIIFSPRSSRKFSLCFLPSNFLVYLIRIQCCYIQEMSKDLDIFLYPLSCCWIKMLIFIRQINSTHTLVTLHNDAGFLSSFNVTSCVLSSWIELIITMSLFCLATSKSLASF